MPELFANILRTKTKVELAHKEEMKKKTINRFYTDIVVPKCLEAADLGLYTVVIQCPNSIEYPFEDYILKMEENGLVVNINEDNVTFTLSWRD